MVKVAHISDPHLFVSYPKFSWLFNKRILGYLDFMLYRKLIYDVNQFKSLLKLLREEKVDYLVISGDISAIALPQELSIAKEWLESEFWWNNKLIVVPGNHDYYTIEAWKKDYFGELYKPLLSSNIGLGDGFPFVKLYDNIAFIGLNSNVVNPPFMAFGKIGGKQLLKLDSLLSSKELVDKLIFIVIHHPPLFYGSLFKHLFRGLYDYKELLKILFKYPRYRFIVLSGHWHTRRVEEHLNVKIFVAPSISSKFSGSYKAGYFIFTISPDNNLSYQFKGIDPSSF